MKRYILLVIALCSAFIPKLAFPQTSGDVSFWVSAKDQRVREILEERLAKRFTAAGIKVHPGMEGLYDLEIQIDILEFGPHRLPYILATVVITQDIMGKSLVRRHGCDESIDDDTRFVGAYSRVFPMTDESTDIFVAETVNAIKGIYKSLHESLSKLFEDNQ